MGMGTEREGERWFRRTKEREMGTRTGAGTKGGGGKKGGNAQIKTEEVVDGMRKTVET